MHQDSDASDTTKNFSIEYLSQSVRFLIQLFIEETKAVFMEEYERERQDEKKQEHLPEIWDSQDSKTVEKFDDLPIE